MIKSQNQKQTEMSTNFLALSIILFVAASGFGQEKESFEGFAWLKKFEGDWKTESKSAGQEKPMATGTFSARPFGKFWMVCEQKANMGGMDFQSIQRIGFNEKTKRYIGTWFDSAADHVWQYDGELNKEGTALILNAQGPDWEDPSKTRDYRDTYKFQSPDKIVLTSEMKIDEDSWKTFMTATITKGEAKKEDSKKQTTVTPFLMFFGEGQAAIDFYKTVFPDTKVLKMKKRKPASDDKKGTIELADIMIAGQRIRIIDSPIKHDFDFTPSFSFFVECENEEQLKERFKKLSKDGKVMMPLNDYGFSKQFGWTSDKFGISWQLNLQ